MASGARSVASDSEISRGDRLPQRCRDPGQGAPAAAIWTEACSSSSSPAAELLLGALGEQLADPPLRIRVLGLDAGGGADAAGEQVRPQRLAAGDRPVELEAAHGEVAIEPGAGEQGPRLGLFGEAGRVRRPRGQGALPRLADLGQGLAGQPVPAVALVLVPDREGDPPAGRSTRANSAAASSGWGRWLRTKLARTASNSVRPRTASARRRRGRTRSPGSRAWRPRSSPRRCRSRPALPPAPAPPRRRSRGRWRCRGPDSRSQPGLIEERLHNPAGQRAGQRCVGLGLPPPTLRLEPLELLGAGAHIAREMIRRWISLVPS